MSPADLSTSLGSTFTYPFVAKIVPTESRMFPRNMPSLDGLLIWAALDTMLLKRYVSLALTVFPGAMTVQKYALAVYPMTQLIELLFLNTHPLAKPFRQIELPPVATLFSEIRQLWSQPPHAAAARLDTLLEMTHPITCA